MGPLLLTHPAQGRAPFSIQVETAALPSPGFCLSTALVSLICLFLFSSYQKELRGSGVLMFSCALLCSQHLGSAWNIAQKPTKWIHA